MGLTSVLFAQVTELAKVHNDLDQIICISKHLRTFALSGSIDREKAERDAERAASASATRRQSESSPTLHEKSRYICRRDFNQEQ